MKFPNFYLGKMIEEKQRNEDLLGTIFFLMGYLRLGRDQSHLTTRVSGAGSGVGGGPDQTNQMGTGSWTRLRGDNATGIQPIDFGKVRSLDFRGRLYIDFSPSAAPPRPPRE